MEKIEKRVLVISYLPPPYDGTSKIGEIIFNSQILNSLYKVDYLRLFLVKNSGDRGKFAFWNVILSIINITRFVLRLVLFNPSIVYMNLAQNRLGFLRDSFFIFIVKLFRKKVIVHFQGGGFDAFYLKLPSIYKKYVKNILGKIEVLILLASSFRIQFKMLVKYEKIRIIYNPFPGKIANTLIKPKENRDLIKILYIGYISKAKGAIDLVQSIPLIREKYKNIIVNMVGQRIDREKNIKTIPDPDNAYKKIIEIIENNYIKDRVVLLESISENEKSQLLLDSDIFILPSYSEGCPISIMEAMAYSLPVVTTPVGALPEMLIDEENCFFVEPGNYKAIAEKVLLLINNLDKRKEMGINNRELIITKYNSEMFCKELSDIWGHFF